MVNWKYKLSVEGSTLRSLIHNEDDSNENKAQIIEQIERCYKALLDKFDSQDKELYEDDFIEFLELIDGEANVIRNNPEVIAEWGDGDYDAESLVNDRLAQFYDDCDSCRCWIEL